MPLRLDGPLAAGKLRTPITIQIDVGTGTVANPVPAVDSRGQPLPNWQTFATGFAQIQPVPRGSREIEAAATRMADQWWDVLTRFIPGVVPTMRLLFGSHVLDIETALDPERRRRRLLMLCLERAAGGTAP